MNPADRISFADNLPTCPEADALSHPWIVKGVLEAIGRVDTDGAIDALQRAEEQQGPEGDDYTALMRVVCEYTSANAHCARTEEEREILARVYSEAMDRLHTFEANR
jgi:hypothetical protein